MWNPFKKKSRAQKLEEVYRIFLSCNLECWDIYYNRFLTGEEKCHKWYKIYTEWGEYIGYKYGQEYLDFFGENMGKRGWVDKKK